MEDDRLEMIEAKAGTFVGTEPVGMYSPHVVTMLAEDSLELVAEVRRLREDARQVAHDAWERGMADAKLQALGIRPFVRNPYLED